MREIKFRAWVKELEKLSAVNEVYFDGGAYVCDYEYALNSEDIELMQFTGLKDKNGVEIYEGDIIGFGDDSETCKIGMYGELGVVFYCKDKAKFMVKLLCSKREVQLDDHNLFTDGHTCRKVLGNEHENPELLED